MEFLTLRNKEELLFLFLLFSSPAAIDTVSMEANSVSCMALSLREMADFGERNEVGRGTTTVNVFLSGETRK